MFYSEPPQKKQKLSNVDHGGKKKTCNIPYDRVVFIDSTWNQTHKICTDERLKGIICVLTDFSILVFMCVRQGIFTCISFPYFVLGLQRVEIKTQKTKFWRHQRDKPDTYLATIEAIYYFIVEYHDIFVKTRYEGQYDNLLFFFCFMYHKIKHLYDGGKKLKAYNKS